MSTGEFDTTGPSPPNWLCSYDGGGFYIDLAFNASANSTAAWTRKLSTLACDGWIDASTSAVFVEFNLYSARTDLFTSCLFLFERQSVTGIRSAFRLLTWRKKRCRWWCSDEPSARRSASV